MWKMQWDCLLPTAYYRSLFTVSYELSKSKRFKCSLCWNCIRTMFCRRRRCRCHCHHYCFDDLYYYSIFAAPVHIEHGTFISNSIIASHLNCNIYNKHICVECGLNSGNSSIDLQRNKDYYEPCLMGQQNKQFSDTFYSHLQIQHSAAHPSILMDYSLCIHKLKLYFV